MTDGRGRTMARRTDLIFYDGQCGLCHRAVRFALRHDADGSRFCFAPLQGETFKSMVAAERRARLPDSMVVLTPDGRVLTKWRAVERMMTRIGGALGVLARAARLIPRPVMDLFYDFVAAVRLRVFARPPAACPFVEADLRKRFHP